MAQPLEKSVPAHYQKCATVSLGFSRSCVVNLAISQGCLLAMEKFAYFEYTR